MDKPFYIYAFGQSDVGMVRKNNEDSLLLSDLTNGPVLSWNNRRIKSHIDSVLAVPIRAGVAA